MVVGYLEKLEPMDLHAWFEAYVGNRWYTFDPTQVDLQGGRVAIAFGRDAADVAIYTQFGDVGRLELKHAAVGIADNHSALIPALPVYNHKAGYSCGYFAQSQLD
jgi:transglutaminase-like putative cysteine protease